SPGAITRFTGLKKKLPTVTVFVVAAPHWLIEVRPAKTHKAKTLDTVIARSGYPLLSRTRAAFASRLALFQRNRRLAKVACLLRARITQASTRNRRQIDLSFFPPIKPRMDLP